MTYRLYFHPLSSFCWKALIALYERDVPFEPVVIDLSDAAERAELEKLWPMAKFPVLRDEARGVTVPESSLIVEYLDRAHPGVPLVPADPGAALEVRILDRFFDQYVQGPMQKVVHDNFRPEGEGDPWGVDDARRQLARAWDVVEARLAANGGPWAAGNQFSLADCAAAPALFYGNIVEPFTGRGTLEAYYGRLLARESVARVIEEAGAYRSFFPLEWPDADR
jgi:glutathione S-transferase